MFSTVCVFVTSVSTITEMDRGGIMRIPSDMRSKYKPASVRNGPEKAFVHAKQTNQPAALCGCKSPPTKRAWFMDEHRGWWAYPDDRDVNCRECIKQLGGTPEESMPRITPSDVALIFSMAGFADSEGQLGLEDLALLRKLRAAYPAVAEQHKYIDLN